MIRSTICSVPLALARSKRRALIALPKAALVNEDRLSNSTIASNSIITTLQVLYVVVRTSLPLLFTMTTPSRVKKPFRLVPAAQAESLYELGEVRHAAKPKCRPCEP